MRPRKEIIRGLHNLRPEHAECVATIGSFDGVHLGHQAVLKQVIRKAQSLGLPAVVILFEPQPTEYLSGHNLSRQKAPARLMRFREKAEALFEAGIERVFCLYFNEPLRSLSASDFIEKVIIQGLQPRYMVVGDDFHFGRDRGGEFALLQQAGKAHGFDVENTDTYEFQGQRVSSTRVREVLAQDNFQFAAQLLGKPYTLSGRVIYGQQLGRQLGVPTANVPLRRHRSPLFGVFAVQVRLCGGERRPGVANIGVRPTVDGESRAVLEVHLLDFDQSIYGEAITVEFEKKLRDERAFGSLTLLKEQIFYDIDAARQFFSSKL